MQAGVTVEEGDAPVESLVNLNFGSSEAEAASLLGDLEALPFPLHDVSLLTTRWWMKQQMRSRFSGAGRQTVWSWRDRRAKRRL